MKRIIFSLLLTIAMVANSMAQRASFNGSWYGTLAGGPYSMNLVFHISQQGDSVAVTWDSPMQQAYGLDATATIDNDSLSIDMPIVQATYQARLAGDRLTGWYSQGDMNMKLSMTQDSNYLADRPQVAAILADTHKPYRSEDVTLTNGDITLAGTLTLPNEGDKFPGVVLVVGSGMLDRDESMFGHKAHLLLADALSRQGFAVLRYDKRGVGASTGGHCTDPTAQLAGDAMAAVRYLASRPEVDASRVGILGHSEGGIIAIMNAAQYPDEIAFIVSMAGVGLPHYEYALTTKWDIERVMGINRDEAEKRFYEKVYAIIGTERDTTVMRERMLAMLAEDPYYQHYLEQALLKYPEYTASDFNEAMVEQNITPENCEMLQYDPAWDLEHVKCPMLAVNGALDFQVGSDANLAAISRHVPHATVKAYENLNHLFQDCSGQDSLLDYAGIKETMSPVVIEDIVTWLKRVVKP